MKILHFILLVLVIWEVHNYQSKPKSFPYSQFQENIDVEGHKSYTVETFPQKISHFNYRVKGTFSQKYLIDLSQWDERPDRPILFYCGNEGPIEMFYKNSGFYNEDVRN